MRWSPEPALALLLLLLLLLLFALPTNRPDLLRGQVHDERGPIAGAVVRFQGTKICTRSDAIGQFSLPRVAGARRVTASKDGYRISGLSLKAPFLDLRLRPLPMADHDAYVWVDPAPDVSRPQNCANCHDEIYREWTRSGHARSATGRHFRDLLDGTDAAGNHGVGWGVATQNPLGVDVCAACHAPAPTPAEKTGAAGLQGVHCDYCHKIVGPGDGTPGLSHGRFNLRLLRPGVGEQLFLGPLDDVDRGEDAYSSFYHDSRYCASCHEGVVFGTHVYSTYSEWLSSLARREGKHCQHCHMTPTGRLHNMAPGHGGIERDPATLGNHRFFDGSQTAMLRRCVSVDTSLERHGDEVRARVSVHADGAGHRVPTGYIDRQLLLVAEGVDAQGRPLAPLRSSTLLPDEAGRELAGKPGRLYAKRLRDESGHRPAPFWSHDGKEPIDTRLTPGQIDRLDLAYPAELARLRLRVFYRRFWDEVVRIKGWRDQDVTVVDQTYRVK
jgi:hypothetical protein